MKMFIPAVGYRIELSSFWTFDLYHETRNDGLLEHIKPELFREESRLTGSYDRVDRYVDGRYGKLLSTSVTIPPGTKLEVDRVYIRTMSKSAKTKDEDYDSITFKVVSGLDTKKKIRFWAKLADVNQLEYELPVDHDIVKVNCAKHIKKFERTTLVNAVHNGFSAFETAQNTLCLGSKPEIPSWITKELVMKSTYLKALYAEKVEPVVIEQHEKYIAYERSKLKQRMETKSLSYYVRPNDVVEMLALSMAKTLDDLKKSFPGLFSFEHQRMNSHKCDSWWDFSRAFLSTSSFKTLEDGSHVRTFRGNKKFVSCGNYDGLTADLSSAWVTVTTNVTDDQILAVDMGID